MTDELNKLLRYGNNQIKEIKEQQLLLIANYIKDKFQLEIGTIIITNKMRGVIVGFEYNQLESKINIKYKMLKYNNTLDKYAYTTKLRKDFIIDGKYTGKIS